MDWIARARVLRGYIEKAVQSLDDGDALEAVELFPEWRPGVSYKAGERVRYDAVLYECVQAHTSQDDWTPNITPALWKAVPEPGTIPLWVQPTGSQDAYQKGDKVRWIEKVWVSDYDANTWEPGVFGWSVSD